LIRDVTAMDRPVDAAPRNRRRLLVGGIVAAIAILLALVVLPGARRWASAERSVDAARLRFATVSRGDLVREVPVQGSVVAAFRPTLTSPARGVVRVEAQPGQVVQRGQVLVRVESPEVASRLAQQRSELMSAQSDLERQRILARQAAARRQQEIELAAVQVEAARRALDRANKTREQGLINAVELEKAQDDLKIAELRHDAARREAGLEAETLQFETSNRAAQVERQRLVTTELERQVGELEVRSPVAGLVSRVMVDDRDSVEAGQPLVGVVDLSKLEVEVWVPESYAPEIAPGTTALVTFDGREWEGEVASLSPEVEASRVRGTVAFRGETPPGLKQNQRLSARLVLETRPGVLKVQRGPFLEAGAGRTAWVVDDGVAQRTAIQVGATSVTEVEIVSGLAEGDEIVLSDPSPFGSAERVALRR
jgi:HlyD family secretion protein